MTTMGWTKERHLTLAVYTLPLNRGHRAEEGKNHSRELHCWIFVWEILLWEEISA